MSNQGYSWRNVRSRSSYFLPRTAHFGRWIGMAVVLGVLFHGLLYLALEKIPVLIAMVEDMGEKKPVVPAEMKVVELPKREIIQSPPLDQVEEPPEESLEISEKIAELEDVMDEAIISPEITDTLADVQFAAPAIKGDSLADSFEVLKAPELDLNVPEIGRNEAVELPKAGDLKIDPGKALADIHDPDAFLREMVKKGADGRSKDGLLKGFTSLEDMKKMDGNALANAKALIGSDLLFEFGKANLKGSARNSLMAVAFLIDKHPEMFCVLDGHTDTVGDEAKNKELSRQRAQAVKDWLVQSLLLDGKRIIVRPFGESHPIVKEGDKSAQALNRRVVISMQKLAPDDEVPKAILVRPGQREPVAPQEPEIPRAEPVDPEIPKAVPDVPRAIPAQP